MPGRFSPCCDVLSAFNVSCRSTSPLILEESPLQRRLERLEARVAALEACRDLTHVQRSSLQLTSRSRFQRFCNGDFLRWCLDHHILIEAGDGERTWPTTQHMSAQLQDLTGYSNIGIEVLRSQGSSIRLNAAIQVGASSMPLSLAAFKIAVDNFWASDARPYVAAHAMTHSGVRLRCCRTMGEVCRCLAASPVGRPHFQGLRSCSGPSSSRPGSFLDLVELYFRVAFTA